MMTKRNLASLALPGRELPEPAKRRELRAATLHRRAALSALALGVGVMGCKPDRSASEALARATLAKHAPRDALRTAAVKDAWADLFIPRQDLGRCPVPIDYVNPKKPAQAKGFDMNRMAQQLHSLERVQREFLHPADLAQASGPLFSSFRQDVENAARMPLEAARSSLARWDDAATWDWDLVVVENDARHPGVANGQVYGGAFRGTAVLYDYTTQTVACMGDIAETSPGRVEFKLPVGATKEVIDAAAARTAERELTLSILERATTRLMRAGPP